VARRRLVGERQMGSVSRCARVKGVGCRMQGTGCGVPGAGGHLGDPDRPEGPGTPPCPRDRWTPRCPRPRPHLERKGAVRPGERAAIWHKGFWGTLEARRVWEKSGWEEALSSLQRTKKAVGVVHGMPCTGRLQVRGRVSVRGSGAERRSPMLPSMPLAPLRP
jgi:hypothetical protein